MTAPRYCLHSCPCASRLFQHSGINLSHTPPEVYMFWSLPLLWKTAWHHQSTSALGLEFTVPMIQLVLLAQWMNVHSFMNEWVNDQSCSCAASALCSGEISSQRSRSEVSRRLRAFLSQPREVRGQKEKPVAKGGCSIRAFKSGGK